LIVSKVLLCATCTKTRPFNYASCLTNPLFGTGKKCTIRLSKGKAFGDSKKDNIPIKEVLNMKAFYLDNIDVATLMKALDECKGNVILLTDEGDRFNLKSKLSQITGIMKLIEGGIVCNAKISCSDPDDEAMLFRLNLFGKVEEEDKADKA
jgi:hypothetical protein